ncbi:MAG TPA: hypothetical protein VN132_01445, partial [Bdellovibrio sp.]|nr:hypothetical protein [Bdellovibrio sp.]
MSQFAEVEFDSLSLFLEDTPVLRGRSVEHFLKKNFEKYKAIEVTKEQEWLSPQLWNMPEVFRKKLGAYSEFYFNEVNEQNRLANIVHYNFSNGMQISGREILRHPLQKKVPRALLPQPKSAEENFLASWPLNQRASFVSQSLKELDEIIQALLNRVALFHRQGKVELYLQSKSKPSMALQIHSLEFDVATELDWRVEFYEKKELEAEFQLMSFRKKPLSFFESFALEPEDGIIIVHPWRREWTNLEEVLSKILETGVSNLLVPHEMPRIDVVGELEVRAILKYLRTRAIPVKISGETHVLSSQQSRTSVMLNENGSFQIQHQARVRGQKDLIRRGWSPRTVLYLRTLSEG